MDKEYIDRDAALRAILGQPPDAHYPGWYADSIKEIPAADVVPVVHSEWDYGDEPLEVDENGNVQAFCKRCGAGDVHAKRNINKVPYCWKCGAKMDGVDYEAD